jgi:hypothetical protein
MVIRIETPEDLLELFGMPKGPGLDSASVLRLYEDLEDLEGILGEEMSLDDLLADWHEGTPGECFEAVSKFIPKGKKEEWRSLEGHRARSEWLEEHFMPSMFAIVYAVRGGRSVVWRFVQNDTFFFLGGNGGDI